MIDLNFKIIYSIHKTLDYVYESLDDLGFYGIIELCEELNIPEDRIIGLDSSDIQCILLEEGLIPEKCYNNINKDIPITILSNDKYILTEYDNNDDSLGLEDPTISRKYYANLNIAEFIELVNSYSGSSCNNTLGMLTPEGFFPAFSIEGGNRDCLEDLYISIFYSEDLSEDKMIEIEESIKSLIETNELSIENINMLLNE